MFRIVILASIFCVSCASDLAEDNELTQLYRWMHGSFSSSDQAETDSSFYDIRLEMAPVWQGRKDAYWLYVEQAAAWAQKEPYRQRVYRLSRLDNKRLESAVFTLPDEKRFVGAFKNPSIFNTIHPDSLVPRNGCAIVLEYLDGAYIGSTTEKECPSTLRGASYATSEVRITSTMLTSWDRGFNKNAKQVWGSAKGPYIFKKK